METKSLPTLVKNCQYSHVEKRQLCHIDKQLLIMTYVLTTQQQVMTQDERDERMQLICDSVNIQTLIEMNADTIERACSLLRGY